MTKLFVLARPRIARGLSRLRWKKAQSSDK
jgi:hypothetical protein